MTPSAHVFQLLDSSPDLFGAFAKAAECSVPLLRRSREEPALLSSLQWARVAEHLEVPASWLGSGEPWHPDMVRALQRNARGNRSSVELQRVRRQALRRLVDGCKKTANLAAMLNTSAPMLAGLMNTEVRPFGSKRARNIEQALGLDDGWFDRNEDVPASLIERASQSLKVRKARNSTERLQRLAANASDSGNQLSLSSLAPLHQSVLAKYFDLAHAGQLDEPFAYRLLGQLMELERGSSAPE